MKYGLSLLFFFYCAFANTANHFSTYQIQLQTREKMTFDNAKIKVKLYGTHRFVMDNSATLIDETVLQIQSLPSTIKLNWPSNGFKLIQNPSVQNSKNAIYYFKISMDINNDGKLCRDDFKQNFKLTPFATLNKKPLTALVFDLIAIESETCEVF